MAYGCYRCGAINGPLKEWDEEQTRPTCDECGESAIVTMQEAMDILNDLHLKGKWRIDPFDADYFTELMEAAFEQEHSSNR